MNYFAERRGYSIFNLCWRLQLFRMNCQQSLVFLRYFNAQIELNFCVIIFAIASSFIMYIWHQRHKIVSLFQVIVFSFLLLLLPDLVHDIFVRRFCCLDRYLHRNNLHRDCVLQIAVLLAECVALNLFHSTRIHEREFQN